MGHNRPLRADAERSMRAIMAAAEEVLSGNPLATMEQVAEAAGVARATVHRRFASREALIEAMELAAWREIQEAVLAARPHTAPALVVLHQATATIVQIKLGWRFTLARELPLSQEAQAVQAEVMKVCEAVFGKLLGPDADIVWARQVYLALLGEAAHSALPHSDPDALATKVIDTLMHGVSGRR
ncbi:helix-turn-helix domain-containing protein [Microbispora sp. H10830]|uniref:TetR/AcrR family transcriptional regulator n=1 Tax=Microbispora sp. H10830 TaxID=2729109 RepID=UPI002872E4E3|nr:helix-turn-helix domain-containing protein [Microbispora sp. H10830]